MLWFLFILALSVALAITLRPLFLASVRTSEARDSELAVYRSQLKELEGDLVRGLITVTDAESARIEIQRKLLSVSSVRTSTDAQGALARRAGFVVVVATPILAFALYSNVGSPHLTGSTPATSSPQDGAQGTSQAPLADVDTMVQRLADRLKQNPSDLKGWKMLGWSYSHTDRATDAADAYRHAISLAPDDASLHALLAETLVQAAGGRVTVESDRAVKDAIALDSTEPRALYLSGLALEQQGHPQDAFKTWDKLLNSSAVNAEWVPELKKSLAALAQKLGKDAAPYVDSTANTDPAIPLVAAGPVSGPSDRDVSAASTMSPEARAEMINGMVSSLVEKLRRNPKDLDGWLMLARSRMVLGDANAARTAVARAQEVFAGDPSAQTRIVQATKDMGLNP
ncbi:MAG: c-type cytochrome biogenesis protein CcmI [Micropepsaceae bacterium]